VRLLEGIVESASHRFSLALAVTSGRDTRTLLAASKSIRDRVYFFTSMWGHMGWQTADIRIPSKLLPELGLTHHVVGCPPRADKEFDRILRESVATAHACYAPIIQGEAQGELPTRVGMLGIGMPVLKVPYRRRLKRWRPQADLQNLDAETIAWCGYRTDPFSHEAIRRWLSDVPRTNVHVLDLFYWEEREGGFEAMTLTEWDLARESFSPYSCRRFMENALSVPESHRSEPEYLFHQELIGRMWPQVLQEPFNPHDEPDIFVTVFTGLTQLREKIDRRSPPSMGLPVVRFFQRYPWLADLRRIGWPLAETRKFLEVRNPNSIDPGPPSQQARNPAASSEPENPGASAAHAAQPVSGDGGGGHRET
jgi:hypothetical protein